MSKSKIIKKELSSFKRGVKGVNKRWMAHNMEPGVKNWGVKKSKKGSGGLK